MNQAVAALTRNSPNGKQDPNMTTKLEGPLRRALAIGGNPYVLTITPEGLTLVPKGKRKGYSLAWNAFVSGEAALATALNASLMVAPAKSSPTEKRTLEKPLRK
jgi:hypothetical protein